MPPSPGSITAAELRQRCQAGGEIAIVDAREEGSFHDRHLLMASCLPLSRLELMAPGLLPRRSAPIVVCDDGEGLAERAAARLIEGGYTDVSVLAGGVAAWEAAGFPVYSGVHVPSKAFAEVVEHEYGTPWISAEELAERQKRTGADGDLRQPVVRGIPLEQHPRCGQRPRRRARLSVHRDGPVARHLRRRQLRRAHAQHHRRAVVDRCRCAEPRRLAKGRHDGLASRRARGRGGRHRRAPRRCRLEGVTAARQRADAVARRYGVPVIDRADTHRMAARGRPPHPLRASMCATRPSTAPAICRDSVMAPGGQLVQETDSWLGVWGARVVLVDDTGVRARMTASWLRRMGWDAAVLEGRTRRCGTGAGNARRRERHLPARRPRAGDRAAVGAAGERRPSSSIWR